MGMHVDKRSLQVIRAFTLLLFFALAGVSSADTLLVRGAQSDSAEQKLIASVADFYGTTIRVVDVSKDSASAVLSRNPDISAVLISAEALSRLDRRQFLSALKRPDGRRIPVLVFGIPAVQESAELSRWSDGAVQACSRWEQSFIPKTLTVGDVQPVTRVLSGLELPAMSVPDCRMEIGQTSAAQVVLSTISVDNTRRTPVLARVKTNAAEIFFSPSLRSLDLAPIAKPNGLSRAFSLLAPYILFFSHATGEYGWRLDGRYANLTIDDAWLTEPYGPMNYAGLLAEMEKHNFHTTLAFVPWNFDRSEQEVVELFRGHANRYSICLHGNDHAHREFGEYSVNSLANQTQDLKQGVARMERFSSLTGLPYDRFMVFPHGVSPEPTFAALKKYGFLGTANSLNVPLGTPFPADPIFLLRPFTHRYAGLLSFSRYAAAGNVPKTEIAIHSFLGNPLLFYDHADFFYPSVAKFNGHADYVNQLQPDTKWTGLSDIARHLYLLKLRPDGAYDVRMLSSEMDLRNPSAQERVYYVRLEDQAAEAALTVDGVAASLASPVRVVVPANGLLKFRVTYPNDLQIANQDVAKRSTYVYVLRMISDFRDLYLMRYSWGNALTKMYYRRNWNRTQLLLERNWWIFLLAFLGLAVGIVRYRRSRKAKREHRKAMASHGGN